MKQMKKESNKSIGEKLGAFTDFIKNTKLLILTAITLVILVVALISGDGKNIVRSFYENITGKKYQTFSPVQDYSTASYIILRDKLSRDFNIEIENTQITIFEESNTYHKYRVEFKDMTYFYSVKKKQNGTWQIKQE